jgi:hypothetical protein
MVVEVGLRVLRVGVEVIATTLSRDEAIRFIARSAIEMRKTRPPSP